MAACCIAGCGGTFRETQWLSPVLLLLTGQCSARKAVLSGLPFTTLPLSLQQFDSLVQGALAAPAPTFLSHSRACRCGFFGRRGFALESAVSGEPHRRCPDEDGAALIFARRREVPTCPELAGGRGRARLVVIAAETGGRFSEETQTLLRLAEAKIRSTAQLLRVRARQSWLPRWSSFLSCVAACIRVFLVGFSTSTWAPMVTRLLSLT